MKVSESLSRLRLLADALPDWERPAFHPPASLASVEALEQAAGVRLPDDFRQFLLQTDAIVAMDIHNGYWIGGIESLIQSISRSDFPDQVEKTRVLPVATDGGGNAFLLSADGKHVWRWDHETGNVTDVASSFGAFLKRVADDWEHYATGNHDWAYLV